MLVRGHGSSRRTNERKARPGSGPFRVHRPQTTPWIRPRRACPATVQGGNRFYDWGWQLSGKGGAKGVGGQNHPTQKRHLRRNGFVEWGGSCSTARGVRDKEWGGVKESG